MQQDEFAFEGVLDLPHVLLALLSHDGHVLRLSPAWEQLLGWPRAELLGDGLCGLIHPADQRCAAKLDLAGADPDRATLEFEGRYRRRDGGWCRLVWSLRRQGRVWHAVARDVTAGETLEEEVRRDALTGLPNRILFMDRLDRALAQLARRNGHLAVGFVDLDHFKVINDGLGHPVGDELLRAAAARLAATLRGTDTVARFGGDEFALLAEYDSSAADVGEIARRVVAALREPYLIGGEQIECPASVGVATTSDPSAEAEDLLREADVAMYRAKAAGGSSYELFDAELRGEVESRLKVVGELRHALERSEFTLHYQPLVSLVDEVIVGCEALVRWQHPERGLLLPGTFIPLAEENGQIVPLGAWVLEEACRQARDWRREGSDLTVSVNVSARQVVRPDFVAIVERALRDVGLPAPSLCLELTESCLLSRPVQVAERLEALKRLGVRIAVDDFGTGASSLSHLRLLPLDVIKIDRSFIAQLSDSVESRAIVKAILSLARDLGVTVMAEGVETERQHWQLRDLGCAFGQGWLYAPARPVAELDLDGFLPRPQRGVGDPFVIREFMRQIGIPARIES